MFNGLEEAALRAVPGLRKWKETLAHCGGDRFMLSGSGSSFFALHDDRASGEDERARVERALARAGLRPRLCVLSRAVGHGARLVV
jgi:4-diphosphocytidyl-2C-methyl-D-erythritol kinase